MICGITAHTKGLLRRYIGSDVDDDNHHGERHEGDDEEDEVGVLGAAGLTAI